jgi:hypothetical protein
MTATGATLPPRWVEAKDRCPPIWAVRRSCRGSSLAPLGFHQSGPDRRRKRRHGGGAVHLALPVDLEEIGARAAEFARASQDRAQPPSCRLARSASGMASCSRSRPPAPTANGSDESVTRFAMAARATTDRAARGSPRSQQNRKNRHGSDATRGKWDPMNCARSGMRRWLHQRLSGHTVSIAAAVRAPARAALAQGCVSGRPSNRSPAMVLTPPAA